MITRDQFEVHVRAEAEKRYDMRWNEYRHLQNAYIAARMEHEWPLVEALYGLCYGPMSMEDAADVAMDVLSPYTTKPIEP
jgi:hypothetical protein